MKKRSESDLLEAHIRKQFNRGCVDYSLLDDGDRILIGLSGGKDSLELTRLLAARSRIFKPRIEVEAAHIIMDNIPYETDRSYLEHFCEEVGIRLHILHSHFDESTDQRKTKCFLCAWNRRKTLFQYATDNGFTKIALGHHQDDILTTLLMNMSLEGSISTMPPLLKMEHYPLSIIRPMCLVREADIARLAQMLGFERQKTLCPYEEKTKRAEFSTLFKTLDALSPEVRFNLWNSMSNVRLVNFQRTSGKP